MKPILILFTLILSNFVIAQNFVDITPNDTKYKFPILEYQENKIVQEKINSYLQAVHLKRICNKSETQPFSNTLRGNEYISWEQFQYNSRIIGVYIYTNEENNDSYEALFDKRTGDFFSMKDLFIDNINKIYKPALDKKIPALIANGTLPAKPRINIAIDLMEDLLRIRLLNIETESIEIPYNTIDSKLTPYGKNLLLNKTDKVLRRPDLVNKILKDTTELGNGSDYKNQIIFKLLILNVKKNGKAIIYRWSNNSKSITEYTEAFVKNQKIEADMYVWDGLSQKKELLNYSLRLNKKEPDLWEGSLQLGSPVYSVRFSEY